MSSVVETPSPGAVPTHNVEPVDPKLAFDNLPVTAPAPRPRSRGFSAALSIGVHALAILSIAVHVLFSPWLLLAVIGILAWVAFRPRRSRR